MGRLLTPESPHGSGPGGRGTRGRPLKAGFVEVFWGVMGVFWKNKNRKCYGPKLIIFG